MPKKKPTAPALRLPHPIHPDAWYTLEQASAIVGEGLGKTTLTREMRDGRLRVTQPQRKGTRFIKGEWLNQWLMDGERPRKKEGPTNNGDGANNPAEWTRAEEAKTATAHSATT